MPDNKNESTRTLQGRRSRDRDGRRRSEVQRKVRQVVEAKAGRIHKAKRRMRWLVVAIGLAASPSAAQVVPDCGLFAYAAKITRVIDGDTVVADIDLGFDTWRHNERLRLAGIQTPEKGAAGFDEASEALANKVSGREVYICTVKAKRSDNEVKGGFGRYLATIWKDGVNLNQWLLDEGLAVPYE